jgi:PTS system galactitol-specific IIB component
MSRKLHVLAVCGSGVVSCSMVGQKVKDMLEPYGISVEVMGMLPQSVKEYVDRGGIDFVVATSPVPGIITVPLIKGVGLLTGFGEEEIAAQIIATAKKILANEANK